MRAGRLSDARIWWLLLPWILGLVGCGTSRPPVPLSGPTSAGTYHTARPGETLASIARTHGTSWQLLASANRLTDPNRIEAGQSIWIPAKPGREGRVAALPLRSGLVVPQGSLRWPVDAVPSSGFGMRHGRFHGGIDIPGAQGTPIVAAADGVVIFSGGDLNGFGNTVILGHANGLATLYAHTSRNGVREGGRVRQGQVVAWMGQTGRAWGTHLHFEVHHHGRLVDPLQWLP